MQPCCKTNMSPCPVILLCLLCVILLFPLPIHALEEGVYYQVDRVIDGDTLVLEGEQHVRLLGIQAPERARKERPADPFAKKSKHALVQMVEGQPLRLVFDQTKKDRYGRWLAHLYTSSGQWVQGELVRHGMARIYSFPDNRANVHALLELEVEARNARLGLWSLPEYQVFEASRQEALPSQGFVVIEGEVQDVAEVRGHIYLNFGTDWREDVTFFIHRKYRKYFDVLDLQALEGKELRGRGWVFPKNGPMIEISHPEQIEVIL
jgi:micrococcal nuclease